MKTLHTLIQQAKLSEALELLASQLQETPQDVDLRSSFIELLCIDGQYERADKQLNLLIKQNPDCLIGATNLRQLIRAAQARLDFDGGAATANLVKDVDEAFTSLLRMRLAYRENHVENFIQSAEQLEKNRVNIPMEIDGEYRDTLRDLDDTLAGFLELFGTDGKYYLVPFDALIRLEMMPVTSLIEHVWRKVDIEIDGGLCGEAFIPMTYINSQTDAEKLGRETDWREIFGTNIYSGVGQKMYLFGDEAVVLSQIQRINKTVPLVV
ncbi:protein of avirulence locus ImpE [Photobacterium aquae]|uniref:Protein of avirulence locus ImpE n=1 Tax=Photobacterium aquae TaxID=1195763 RepID=A0A0J1GVT5_9GAMM|nr:type VI secretion system accessory protein TagJ [Photobacterium aquae]KLV03736.1 protein of avirulence locus ImpE [Photobacterium aquae]